MANTLKLAKSLLSPPGDTIQEHIDFIGMSQVELAERMGRPKEKVNDLIKGREPITTATAFQLENVLGIPAGFWMNREKDFRKEIYELMRKEEMEREQEWLTAFPIKEMQKRNWLPSIQDKHQLLDALLKFFSLASIKEWKRIYIDERLSVAFRVSLAHTKSPHAISVWLRAGEIQVSNMELAGFNKKKFRESMAEIRELAFLMPDDYSQQLQHICAQCGVAVVFTPPLPHAPISGATRWYRGHPMVQLSGRFKTNDHFWFTFFHEAGHVLLHSKKNVFLENLEGLDINREKENEADVFAANILLNEKQEADIIKACPLTEKEIEDFAEIFRTPAGVIIGRLQYLEVVPFSFGNGLKHKINLFSEKHSNSSSQNT